MSAAVYLILKYCIECHPKKCVNALLNTSTVYIFRTTISHEPLRKRDVHNVQGDNVEPFVSGQLIYVIRLVCVMVFVMKDMQAVDGEHHDKPTTQVIFN